MEGKNIKELSIGVMFGICTLGLIILLGFSIYNLYKTLAPTWGVSYHTVKSDMPSMWGMCEKFKDTYVVSVNINNQRREVKDIKCKLASKGGMAPDKEEETIALLSPHSSDFCEFYLKGEPLGPVRVRVTYTMKFLTGYKKYSTLVEPSPTCSSLVKPPSQKNNELKDEGM